MAQIEGAGVESGSNKNFPAEKFSQRANKKGREKATKIGRSLVNSWAGKAGDRVYVEYYSGTVNDLSSAIGRVSFLDDKNASVQTVEHAVAIKVGSQTIRFRNLKKIRGMEASSNFTVVVKKTEAGNNASLLNSFAYVML